MSAAPFLAALYALRTGLLMIDVISPAEAVVIEISREAGFRFELWLKRSTDTQQRIAMGIDFTKPMFRDIDAETDNPKREMEIRGVKMRWPTGRIHDGDRPRPRPVVEDIPHG